MSDLRELYQEMIIDHGRRPRNFCATENATHVKDGFNPLCGDRLTLYITLKDGVIESASFEGSGCAISMASASLMTEYLKGKTEQQARQFFENFHAELMSDEETDVDLGKLEILTGVKEFPARVKCATLGWHTMVGALDKTNDKISTE